MNELDRSNETPFEDDLDTCAVLLEQYCAVENSSFDTQLAMIQKQHVATPPNQTYKNCIRDHKSVQNKQFVMDFQNSILQVWDEFFYITSLFFHTLYKEILCHNKKHKESHLSKNYLSV